MKITTKKNLKEAKNVKDEMLNMQEKSFPDQDVFEWQKIAKLMTNFDEIEICSLSYFGTTVTNGIRVIKTLPGLNDY